MPEKIFLINPKTETIGKEKAIQIELDKQTFSQNEYNKERDQAKKTMSFSHETLKHVFGRVIVKIDAELKNEHTFSGGLTIRRERKFNNFNFREVNPSNGVIVSAENIPTGSEVLFDYTVAHDSNKIFSYKSASPDIVYYSVKEEDCYAWKDENGEYKPLQNYEFGLRVFKPYQGNLVGIQPTLLKDVLLVTTGSLKGNVVRTLKACDYQIVFQGNDGKEQNIIRFRHSDNPNFDREEIICIANDLTEELNNGNLLVGLNVHDAKKIKYI